MIPDIASIQAPAVGDLRLAAFLATGCPEVFHSVATPTAIWQADPYDVASIHGQARETFDHLLYRNRRTPQPPSGAVLVLQGEAGSGKTHLMRAFRNRAHSQGHGYCCYLQMTTEVTNYARYMLANVIDGLEQPYAPDGSSRTGLARLSATLLEMVPGLSLSQRDEYREGDGNPAELADDYADRLQQMSQFRDCDLELVRVMLHLERNEPRVRSRALMWLRCQEMRPQDREWIGGAVPRSDEAEPMRMLIQIAKLIHAVHAVPLVLLIDQLEDMANQSAPVERFRKVVDAITAFTDTVSNSVVVLTCLEDYFKTNLAVLIRSKQDRLIRDPEPIRLHSNRSLEEIRLMTIRRLAHLYDSASVDVDRREELYPFRDVHLVALNNMRTRDALDFLRRHHQRCITEGRWIEPEVGSTPSPTPPIAENNLVALWNDFHSTFKATVPDAEEDLATTLSVAINSVNGELSDGFHFGIGALDGRYLELETHRPDNKVNKLLVAVCNARAGVSLIKQVGELEKRAGEIPVAIIRTTNFPKTGKAIERIAGLLNREGRKVVVADSDWRRMLAFEAFRQQHGSRADFAGWQKSARPLGELDSLQRILRLDWLTPSPRPEGAAPIPPPPRALVVSFRSAPAQQVSTVAATGPLVLGHTQSLIPSLVTLEPDEFVQHAAFLGGTGSGKTTAALNLIEQLLARGIPAVLLDRKGDLCRYADPTAWHRPLKDQPARAQLRQELRSKLDVALYTPGESTGRPLALTIVPPGFDQLGEADRERFSQYAAAALGSMIGFRSADSDQGQRAILAKAIETLALVPGMEITVPRLRHLIEHQDGTLLNAIGGGYPDRYYTALAQRLLTLELNHRQLLTGEEQLDVDALLGTGPYARPGRVRLTVISTRFLGDVAKVDFWVSQLLVAVSRWCARSPQPHLQAVFLFDEADLYLPAGTKQPATKAPMEDLLKRARSAGVGIFLATQSPGDFDYKCKENIRTWLIGRVREPRAIEKLKPLLLAAQDDAIGKLAGQKTGDFYLVRESSVIAVRSEESLLRTEQLSENQISQLARRPT